MPLRSGRSAAWVGAAILAGIVLLAQPWGNYPTNDDWQYARVARRLAETGTFEVDVPIAPSLVGQAYAVLPLIRAFGFSHTLLRITTLVLAVVLLYLLDRLMGVAGLDWTERALAVATLAVNPLFANLSLSFMTEVYGYVPALLGAWVWFRGRHRPSAAALLAGALCGASFWIRQYAVLVLPALWIGACCASGALTRARLGALVRPAATSLAGALPLVAGYFVWAQRSGALRPEFSDPLARLLQLDPRPWAAEAGPFVIFMALSCAPILAMSVVRRRRLRASTAAASLAVASLSLASAGWFQSVVDMNPRLDFSLGHHSSFPFVGNIVSRSGIGAVTLTDVYWQGAPGHPRWYVWVWYALVVLAIAATTAAGLSFKTAAKADRAADGDVRREVVGFGIALALLSFAVAVQAYGVLMFDRYYFPALLGATLAAATQLLPKGSRASGAETARARWAPRAALALIAWLAIMTTAGIHNYFRWNDARWALYEGLLSKGVDPRIADGGYEVQGWHALDRLQSDDEPSCIGPCACAQGWYCLDNSYRITMNPVRGYHVVEEVQPAYWLAEGPPLRLLRRAQ